MKEYKEAEIYFGAKTGKDITKQWYVYYYFMDPATRKFKRFIEKKGINRFHTIRERTSEATALREAINLELKSGYNPFGIGSSKFTMSFAGAMDYCLTKKEKSWSRKTYLDYRSGLKYIKIGLQQTKLDNELINEVRRGDIKRLLYRLKEDHSVNTVNKYLALLKSFFAVLVEDELIEVSPVHGIKEERQPERKGYKTMSKGVREKVKELTYEESFAFGVVCETIYQTGIRPAELLSLQWDNIDLQDLIITVIESKNRKIRIVPINQSLADKYLTIQKNITGVQNDWYIFSNKFTLASGPKRLHRNRLTEMWDRVIHKNGGLPTDLKLYGLKHSGADDKIMSGIPIEYLRDLYGHHSTKMTRVYAKKMIEKSSQVIRDQSPEF
ncbi:MAG: tyrosine-type recombinase/integrase [Bacteroidia bacterium]|jgi:site-specific recombinase XerD